MAAMYIVERIGASPFPFHHFRCELANKNSFIQSFNDHLLRSYYILSFVVVVGYTKDAKTSFDMSAFVAEASVFVKLIF